MTWLSDDKHTGADAPLADWERWYWATCALAAFVFLVAVGIAAVLR